MLQIRGMWRTDVALYTIFLQASRKRILCLGLAMRLPIHDWRTFTFLGQSFVIIITCIWIVSMLWHSWDQLWPISITHCVCKKMLHLMHMWAPFLTCIVFQYKVLQVWNVKFINFLNLPLLFTFFDSTCPVMMLNSNEQYHRLSSSTCLSHAWYWELSLGNGTLEERGFVCREVK